MTLKSSGPEATKIPGAALIPVFPRGGCLILHWLWELHWYPSNKSSLLFMVQLHFHHLQPRVLTL